MNGDVIFNETRVIDLVRISIKHFLYGSKSIQIIIIAIIICEEEANSREFGN